MEVGRKAVRSQAAELAAVGSHEEERVRGADDARSGGNVFRDRSRVRTGELDERGDPGGVVVCARPRADVVEVREDCERLRRAAGDRDDQVLEPDAAASGDRGRERLAADMESEVRNLVGKPLPRAVRAG